jgi:hypothetical protein
VIGAAETGGHVISVDSGKGDEYTGDPPAWEALTETSSMIEEELGLKDHWALVVKDDLEFAKEYRGEIEVLFMDTSHSYEQTKKELEAWGSKVVNGGFIIIHDTVSYPEQNKAIWEFLSSNPLSQYVEHENCNGLGIIIKDSRRPKQPVTQLAREGAMSKSWQERIDRMQETLSEIRLQLRAAIAGRESANRRLAGLTKTDDPLSALLQVYWTRLDLQDAFPEAKSGEYQRLMEWAGHIVASRAEDIHYKTLSQHGSWFTRNPWLIGAQDNLTQSEKRVAELVSKLDSIEQSASIDHHSKLQRLGRHPKMRRFDSRVEVSAFRDYSGRQRFN